MTASKDNQEGLAFGRGFIAMQYLLGRRNGELTSPVGLPTEASNSCEALVVQLRTPDKGTRARALAAEMAILVRALQQREVA